MKKKLLYAIVWLLFVWFPFFMVVPVFGQFDDEETSESLFGDETVDEMPVEDTPESIETTLEPVETTPESAEIAPELTDEPDEPAYFSEEDTEEETASDDLFSDESPAEMEQQELKLNDEAPVATQSDERKSVVQNAVLEGVQLSSEPGEVADESIITCYFIFRDRPTSYFYEVKMKDKAIVFEFNDVERGVSPIPSAKEIPIQGFRIENEKVNANREVVGLKAEWHDILKITFFMDAIPEITVKDEYSVISFAFKWSSNPDKIKELAVKEENKKPLLFGLLGGGVAIGGGLGAFLLLRDTGGSGEEIKPLTGIENEIVHPDPLD